MTPAPETPAPLSFDSPQVQEAMREPDGSDAYQGPLVASLLMLRMGVSMEHRMVNIIHATNIANARANLAKALTHEHEARVRAEQELAVAKKLADESEAHAQHESKLRDTMQTNCAGWAERIQQAEAERDSLRKALEAAQPYVVWCDPEGRDAGDYPEAKAIVERDAKLVAAALSGLPAQAVVKP